MAAKIQADPDASAPDAAPRRDPGPPPPPPPPPDDGSDAEGRSAQGDPSDPSDPSPAGPPPEGSPDPPPPDDRGAETPSAPNPKQGVIAAARALFPGLEVLGLDAVSPDEAVYAVADPRGGDVFTLHVFRAPRTLEESAAVGSVAETLSTLSVPGVARLIHCEVRNGHPCFAFPRPVGGESLTELLARDAVSPTMAVRLLVQVCRSLAGLHDAGVYHHVLHPGVIHVAPDGTTSIQRPGFANVFAAPPGTSARVYASAPPEVRSYLAPELLDPQASPDHRADLFSVGAILLRCLTGSAPSPATGGVARASGLDPKIDGVIATCLEPSPGDRCSDAALLADALVTIGPADDSTGLALPPDPGGATGGRARHHPWDGTRRAPPGAAARRRRRRRSRTPLKPAAAALVAVGLAAGGVALWQSDALQNAVAPFTGRSLLESVGDPALIDGTILSPDERMERFNAVRSALASSGPDPGEFAHALVVMQRLSDYTAAEAVIAGFLSALDSGDPGATEIEAEAAAFTDKVAGYRSAMAEASNALDSGDDAGEQLALNEALTFLPHDARAAAALDANPRVAEERILRALAELEDLAGDGRLLVSYQVHRGSSRLDLSSNGSLASVAPLAGVAVDELDLSGTAVSNLSPLRGMRLRRLWLDDTSVTDLSPLHGMPLEGLSYERTGVTGDDDAAELPRLESLRFTTAGGEPANRIPTPAPGAPWENDLGMRFVPAGGTGTALVSRWETRAMDWFRFRDDSPGGGASGTPPGEPGSRLPVTGITLAEAEAFCEWLTRRGWDQGFLLGPEMRYRLPTDLEWSRLAGFDEHPMLSPSARELQGETKLYHLPPVRLPVSHALAGPGAVTGLAGNVREWTASAVTAAPESPFAIRGFASGGGAGDDAAPLTVDLRQRHPAPRDHTDPDTGFRVLLDFGDGAPDAPGRQAGAAGPGPGHGADLSNLVTAGQFAAAAELATSWVADPPTPHHLSTAEAFLAINSIREFFQAHNKLPSSFRKDVLYFRGHRYWLCPLPLDWHTAKNLADSAAAHLATLNTPEEMEWFKQKFARPESSAPAVWVGAEPGGGASPEDPPTGWFWDGNPRNPLPPEAPTPPASGDHRLLIRPSDSGATWHQAPASERCAFLIEWG